MFKLVKKVMILLFSSQYDGFFSFSRVWHPGKSKGVHLFKSMHYCSCIVKFHTGDDRSMYVGLGRGSLHHSYEGLNCESILISYVYIWRNNIINSLCMFQLLNSGEIFNLC